nr:hypothetical protein CFP56_11753 [Quercus suber]
MAGSHAATQRCRSSKISPVHSGLPQASKRRARALITYGKPTKPMSLTGTHFMRKDVFDLSSDDEKKQIRVTSRSCPGPAERCQSSNGSLLSVAKLSQLQPQEHASPRSRTKNGPANENAATMEPQSVEKMAAHQDISNLIPRRGVQHKLPSHAVPPCQTNRTVFWERSVDSLPNAREARSARTEKLVPHASAPRLALDELTLVDYPMTPDCDQEPENTPNAFERQDPILDEVSIAHLRQAPFTHPHKFRNTLRSSQIGKRIKIQLHRNRTAKRRRRDCTSSLGDRWVQRGADGFESSEMKVNRRHLSTRRPRKPLKLVKLDIAALELRSGPLPQVTFSSADEMLTLPCEPDSTVASCYEREHGNGNLSQHNLYRPHRPKTSFQKRNEWIMAQLSSISAPTREGDDEDSGSQAQTDGSEEDESGDTPESDEDRTEEGEGEDDDCHSALWTQLDEQELFENDESGTPDSSTVKTRTRI